MTGEPFIDLSPAAIAAIVERLPDELRREMSACATLIAVTATSGGTMARLWAERIAPTLERLVPDNGVRSEVKRAAGLSGLNYIAEYIDTVIDDRCPTNAAQAVLVLERLAARDLPDAHPGCADRCWHDYLTEEQHALLTGWESDGAAGVARLIDWLFSDDAHTLGAQNFRSFAEQHTWTDRGVVGDVVDVVDLMLERMWRDQRGAV